jgi:hypothetical protein
MVIPSSVSWPGLPALCKWRIIIFRNPYIEGYGLLFCRYVAVISGYKYSVPKDRRKKTTVRGTYALVDIPVSSFVVISYVGITTFTEPEYSSSYSQEPVTGSYSERHEYCPRPPVLFLWMILISSPPYTLRLSKYIFPFGNSNVHFVQISHFPPVWNMPKIRHRPWLDTSSNVAWREQFLTRCVK